MSRLSPYTHAHINIRELQEPSIYSLYSEADITPSLANATHPNKSRFPNRKKRFITAIASALLPAAGKLVTLAVEELGGYLQRKRNKAFNKALEQLEFRMDRGFVNSISSSTTCFSVTEELFDGIA